jgi:hypothetical protein
MRVHRDAACQAPHISRRPGPGDQAPPSGPLKPFGRPPTARCSLRVLQPSPCAGRAPNDQSGDKLRHPLPTSPLRQRQRPRPLAVGDNVQKLARSEQKENSFGQQHFAIADQHPVRLSGHRPAPATQMRLSQIQLAQIGLHEGQVFFGLTGIAPFAMQALDADLEFR